MGPLFALARLVAAHILQEPSSRDCPVDRVSRREHEEVKAVCAQQVIVAFQEWRPKWHDPNLALGSASILALHHQVYV